MTKSQYCEPDTTYEALSSYKLSFETRVSLDVDADGNRKLQVFVEDYELRDYDLLGTEEDRKNFLAELDSGRPLLSLANMFSGILRKANYNPNSGF